MLPLDPNESLGFHCSLTTKAFMNALERRLKGTGVSKAQFLALEHLFMSGPLSLSELVDRLSITPASGVRLVDRMVRDGWVKRQFDSKDGRVKLLVPTKLIAKQWPEISHVGRQNLGRAYQGIDRAEIETVKRILKKIRENLKT